MGMPGRKYSAGSGYRYGFNGKENDNEVKGEGNLYDFGGRMQDPRLGRWFSTDPMERIFPYSSPYTYALDNPNNVIDPDGNLIIFINGQHIGNQGGKSSYWGEVDKKIMNQIGDHIALYRDGSSGGFLNTFFSFNFLHSNLNARVRVRNGYMQGSLDAGGIIARLRRDPKDPNKITETIKIVTHSMGTAYSRGYTAALEDYVDEYNKNNPNGKLKGFKMEIQVDIAAFQGSELPADKNVQTSVHMSGDKDDVANGKGTGKSGKLLRILSSSSDVPDSKEISTLPGTTHSIKDYGNDFDIKQIPKAKDFFQLPQVYIRTTNVPDASSIAPKIPVKQ